MQLARPFASRGTRARWMTSVLVVATLALAAFAPASRAQAVDNGTYGIRPSNEADFFHLAVAPGSSLDAEAVVTNHTSEPVTLLTYPVDATSEASGFAMQDQGAPREGVGAWLQLQGEEVTVPANADMRVPFRLTVPDGTRPGDYAGALIIQAPAEEGETAELEDGTAVRLDVVQRLGVRIYLDVAGEAITALEPGGLTWSRDGDSLTFSLPLSNTGNTNLAPAVELELDGWPGESRRLTFQSSQELLTGSSHVLEATVDGVPPLYVGNAEAIITSEAGETRVADSVGYAEWWLILILVLALAVAALVGWRVTRFVRRARRALAEVEQRRAIV